MTNDFPKYAVVDTSTGKVVFGWDSYNDCERWRCDAKGNWNYEVLGEKQYKELLLKLAK